MHMVGYYSLAVGYTHRYLRRSLSEADACSDSSATVIAKKFLWALASSVSTSESYVQLLLDVYKDLADIADPDIVHKLAVLSQTDSSIGDPLYAKDIYDDMGESFESKLVDHLGYRGPWILYEALVELRRSRSADALLHRMLDLGCGSGLCGRVFSSPIMLMNDANKFVFGVDVSQKMVDITLRNGQYDAAVCADLIEALEQLTKQSPNEMTKDSDHDDDDGHSHHHGRDHDDNEHDSDAVRAFRRARAGGGFDIVTAADTFIYVGALGRVFALVHQVLRDDGEAYFLFSVELLEESPMHPQRQHHHHDHHDDTEEDQRASIAYQHEPGGHAPSKAMVGLLSSGRYAHSPQYIENLCQLYRLRIAWSHRHDNLRTEGTTPLPGMFFILEKVKTP